MGRNDQVERSLEAPVHEAGLAGGFQVARQQHPHARGFHNQHAGIVIAARSRARVRVQRPEANRAGGPRLSRNAAQVAVRLKAITGRSDELRFGMRLQDARGPARVVAVTVRDDQRIEPPRAQRGEDGHDDAVAGVTGGIPGPGIVKEIVVRRLHKHGQTLAHIQNGDRQIRLMVIPVQSQHRRKQQQRRGPACRSRPGRQQPGDTGDRQDGGQQAELRRRPGCQFELGDPGEHRHHLAEQAGAAV